MVVAYIPELFFKKKHPDSEDWDWELISYTNRVITLLLFVISGIRTLILIVVIYPLLFFLYCPCVLCIKSCYKPFCGLLKAKATHRFFSFNCNCPCYRARPKLRFQLQLAFLILVSLVRIATILFCLLISNHITTKSLAVVIAISFIFLLLNSLLDYYHYRVWWKYKPKFVKLQEEIILPKTTFSTKHKRYLPYPLLGDKRTGSFGDGLCTNKSCTNRKLEHILIFHLSDYQPQPRWSELKRLNPSAETYIGFHRTSAHAAAAIAHSDFRRSVKPPQMLGFGIYFARSIKNTDGKARFKGAIIAAEIRMGNVKEVTRNELNTVRNTDEWHPEFDTVYFNHEDDQRDEFCIYDETQILKWIIVVDREHDDKFSDFGMDSEFYDTKCYCI
ncbi:unnamed protein product [Adineta steineri]|uniref:PARP catalytic domain-containing protein n=1 Tax=Adineta steineri TaxID=433720 RepID=A0A819P2U2_9BILA|nr:unnamed protein product [Adineta steineri]CAF4007704.1 unnamed protein product [Adineta steineri]